VTRKSDDTLIITGRGEEALALPMQAVLELTGGGHQPSLFHAACNRPSEFVQATVFSEASSDSRRVYVVEAVAKLPI